jgi:hypothetical protein
MTSTRRPPRPPGWLGRRVIDILVYGTAAVPVGFGLLMLDSALIVAVLPSREHSELSNDPELAWLLTATASAVLLGACVIASRIRYVRAHPLGTSPHEPAPLAPSAPILTPREEMPSAPDRVVVPAGLRGVARGPFAPQTDGAGPPPDRATPTPEPVDTTIGSGGSAIGLVIGFGAAAVTVAMLIGVTVAFMVATTPVGASGGLLVGGIVVTGSVLAYARLHRMGTPAPTSLGLDHADAVDQRRDGVSAGWVIAWSIALTIVAMYALLESICSFRI